VIRRGSGFTLVEVLVALAAMALMSAMAWRGIDAMGAAQSGTARHSEDLLTLQTGLSQWTRDLESVAQSLPSGVIDFDGRVLRIARYHGVVAPGLDAQAAWQANAGVRVVAWGVRMVDGVRVLMRWQSAPAVNRDELQAAWADAAAWGQNPTSALRKRELVVAAVDEWQIFYFRNNSWSSPLSSASVVGGATGSGSGILPDGVRLQLTLSSGQSLTGRLVRDWVRPGFGIGSP
jgi:general secretion pathway protein J